MAAVTVIIPSYNGIEYLPRCIASLEASGSGFDILVVDDASTDDSVSWLSLQHPEVRVLVQPANRGFAAAVNAGILACDTPYVLLLNNDTEVLPGFVEALTEAIAQDERVFSVQALILRMDDEEIVDDAGDYISALGWPRARGRGHRASRYSRPRKAFSTCACAAIYRRDAVIALGLFDEAHFAYLEDIDLGFRAQIDGYRCEVEPAALVRHIGSATAGRRSELKTRLSAANSLYVLYKNLPAGQFIFNLPFYAIGCIIKAVFFAVSHLGRAYCTGLVDGVRKCRAGRERHVRFRLQNLGRYLYIQLQLWGSMFI